MAQTVPVDIISSWVNSTQMTLLYLNCNTTPISPSKSLVLYSKKLKDRSAGQNKIGYPLFKNLPPIGKIVSLKILNEIWLNGVIPQQWKERLIIPIPKPQQNLHLTNSYRLITLHDCSGKFLERMVKRHLVSVLESSNRLDIRQYGFCPGCSTDEHLAILESILDDALRKKTTTSNTCL
ncbi:uncharacterized protein LOC129742108 [Uranotaenia lowii]|uniref:uncharacterized protein LOC129742108 n=1 Tax=Uranotaenia lowii TaxID=190385 RepID=UPI002478C80A|nr:uncharacterized protein LOC129742108 [Uranotaenia lowii]